MSLILILLIVLLLFGGTSGYYAHQQWGAPGLGGVLGTVVIILLFAFLLRGSFY